MKMSDSEIINALECCSNKQGGLKNCSLHNRDGSCTTILASNALALIKRKNSEVERVRKYDIERDIRLHEWLTKKASVEAIKEFAERLKEKSKKRVSDNYGARVYIKDIDNLVEEMTKL